jgi:hypothetical protein
MSSVEQAQQQVAYFEARIVQLDERWKQLKDNREDYKTQMEEAQRKMNTLRDRRIELNRQKRRAEDQLRQYRNRSMRTAVARSDDYSSVGHKEPRVSVPLTPASPSSDDADYGCEEWSSSVVSASGEEDDDDNENGREVLTASTVDAATILAAVAQLSSDESGEI